MEILVYTPLKKINNSTNIQNPVNKSCSCGNSLNNKIYETSFSLTKYKLKNFLKPSDYDSLELSYHSKSKLFDQYFNFSQKKSKKNQELSPFLENEFNQYSDLASANLFNTNSSEYDKSRIFSPLLSPKMKENLNLNPQNQIKPENLQIEEEKYVDYSQMEERIYQFLDEEGIIMELEPINDQINSKIKQNCNKLIKTSLISQPVRKYSNLLERRKVYQLQMLTQLENLDEIDQK